jgi:hypothetical protein
VPSDTFRLASVRKFDRAALKKAPPKQEGESDVAVERRWFYWSNGERYGPYTFAEMITAAGDGFITPDTHVCCLGWQEWHPARTVGGLIVQQPNHNHHNRWLTWAWLCMVAVLATSTIAWGANTHHFWLWWETGALAITTLYTIVFYIGLFVRRDDDGLRLYKGIEGFIGIVPVCCSFAVIFLICSTSVSMLEASDIAWFHPLLDGVTWLPNHHVVSLMFLVLAAFCFCSVDLIFHHTHANERIQKEFGKALLFNGVPVFVAFFLLFIFVYRFDNRAEWADVLRSFIGGAVAFETILSNTMFAILFYEPKV